MGCVVTKNSIYLLHMEAVEIRENTEEAMRRRISGWGKGRCFTPSDFTDLGSSEAIRVALHRLAEKGKIRRILHGVYEFPRAHERLGVLPPKIESVASAIARRDRIRLLPSGTLAANLLGLSEQVPAKVVYRTDGASKAFDIGKTKIVFKKTAPKTMAAAGSISGTVFQALKYIGKEYVTPEVVSKLKRRLSEEDLERLFRDAHLAPVWITKIIESELRI